MSLGDRMDLSSYLLKPVQRMGKYALLLKQILKECPENEQQDHADLTVSQTNVLSRCHTKRRMGTLAAPILLLV